MVHATIAATSDEGVAADLVYAELDRLLQLELLLEAIHVLLPRAAPGHLNYLPAGIHQSASVQGALHYRKCRQPALHDRNLVSDARHHDWGQQLNSILLIAAAQRKMQQAVCRFEQCWSTTLELGGRGGFKYVLSCNSIDLEKVSTYDKFFLKSLSMRVK